MASQSPQDYFDSIPRSLSHKLDKKLDSEHDGVQEDLGTIADSMDEWEGKIAEELQLTKPEIEAIKIEHPGKLRLQTRAALQKWQEKFGPMATYRNLITAFVRAGKGNCAEAVRRVLRKNGQSDMHKSPPPSKRQKLDPLKDLADELVITQPEEATTRIRRRWEEIDALKKYSLVILVRLREKRVQEAKSIEDLCLHESPDLRQAVAAEIEACEGRGVLFILDGFDELPTSLPRESTFVKLIQGTYLSLCTVLVTSRPSATADLRKVAQCQIHKQIEVIGFTQEQIEEYAREAFASQPHVLADFLTYISTNPAIKSMMYIPLNSAIVVDIYNRTASRPIPQTMTQLYVELSLILLERHLREDNPLANQLPQKLEDLPPQLYQPFNALAKLAFEGLAKKEVVFHEIPGNLEHFGFMNSPTELYAGRKVSVSCSFLHLTLQEFLAAFYISQLSAILQTCVFKNYCEEPGWEVVWRFVAGLTGFRGIGWNVVEARRGRNKDGWISSFIIRYLYEAQNKADYESIFGENELKCNLSGSTALDIYAVGCCVANSKCMWKLDMSEVSLGGTLVEMLKHGLSSSKSLPHKGHANISLLQLVSCHLNSAAFDYLADIIPLMTNLWFLNISYNPAGEGGLVKLLNALSHLKNLQEFQMRDTKIGCTDVEALSPLISPSSSSSLKKLVIGDEKMSDECKEVMFKTVLSPSSLESVEFCEVDWTDQAMKLLEKNTNLGSLECYLRDEYYQCLDTIFKGLSKKSYLKELKFNLLYSPENFDEIKHTLSSLSAMLKKNNTLQYLTIISHHCTDILFFEDSDCSEGDDLSSMFTNLNKALKRNYALKKLELIKFKPESSESSKHELNVKLDQRIVIDDESCIIM